LNSNGESEGRSLGSGLEKQDVCPGPTQEDGRRGARRPAADDDYPLSFYHRLSIHAPEAAGSVWKRFPPRLTWGIIGLVLLRAFGKTDLSVSEVGLGCARIGGIFQRETPAFLNLLSAARDGGINFFDTADMYSQGESEELVGRAFRQVRDKVVIASKAGYCLPARRKFAARLKPILKPVIQFLKIRRDRLPAAARGALAQDFSPAYLRKAVEGSLRRLRTDYLDVFQLHSPPAEVVVRGEWEPMLESLKRAGKIRYYGVSCDAMEAGLAALRYPGVSVVQFPINLLEQRAAETLGPHLRAGGVAGIARECLANGLLVKEAHEVDVGAFCSSDEQRQLREQQLTTFRERAKGRGVTLARLAMDYVASVDGVSVSLIGARSVEQLNGLLGALA
jgi:aryl-alcohol dehydrogenase-like predicted oxidoreductase